VPLNYHCCACWWPLLCLFITIVVPLNYHCCACWLQFSQSRSVTFISSNIIPSCILEY
jgi:hypothetical protein